MSVDATGYEFFEHTADIGIRAEASTLQALFVAMARGLTELIAEDSTIRPEHQRSIELEAPDASTLLLVWLTELLFWFSTERFLPVEYSLQHVTATRLQGVVRGGIFSPARDVQGREVKAITRHRLAVEQRNSVWRAEAIVDI